ncbi:hypothetical protein WME86_29845 [Sorangium sp. So ce1024]
MLLGRLLALHLTAPLLANLLGGLRAVLVAALLALELTALLLAALLALELTALLLALLLGRLRALLLGGLRALLLGGLRALLLGRLRALLLGGLRALLLGGLRTLLLSPLLLAGLLLLQRAEDLLGAAQVSLEVRPQLDEVRPEARVLHAFDELLVDDLEGAAVQRDLGPDERHVELCAFLLLQGFAGLDRARLELSALRARREADPGAPRQLGPVLLRPGVLVDHLLREALHLGRIGLLPCDLRLLDLLLVDERDQRRELLLGRLPHRAVAAGLSIATLAVALEAGVVAARLLLARAPIALLAPAVALEPGLLAAALPSTCAARAIAACLAATPAVSAPVFTGVALAAGRGLAVRIDLVGSTGDAPAGPRECKAPREHDRREAT